VLPPNRQDFTSPHRRFDRKEDYWKHPPVSTRFASFDELLKLSGLQPSFSRVGSGTKANPIERIRLKRQTPLVSCHFKQMVY